MKDPLNIDISGGTTDQRMATASVIKDALNEYTPNVTVVGSDCADGLQDAGLIETALGEPDLAIVVTVLSDGEDTPLPDAAD